jgi:hypothetical protein
MGICFGFGGIWFTARNAIAIPARCKRTYSGIAPVMEKSGKKQWIHFRWACPKFLRQSFHECASPSIGHSVWARAYYRQQRGKGVDHHGAVRTLAFKWIRIVFDAGKSELRMTKANIWQLRGSRSIHPLSVDRTSGGMLRKMAASAK